MEYRNAHCYIKIDRYILLYFNSLGLCSRIEKDRKEEIPLVLVDSGAIFLFMGVVARLFSLKRAVEERIDF